MKIGWQFQSEQLRWIDSSFDCPPLESADDKIDEDERLHRDGSSFESSQLESDEDHIEENVEISRTLRILPVSEVDGSIGKLCFIRSSLSSKLEFGVNEEFSFLC